MIWVAIALLATASLAPLAWSLRTSAGARGRREAALALHRGQLAELERDLADGRLGPGEHESAVLEVQRRLLAAASDTDSTPASGRRWPLYAALAVVPALAFALYLVGGSPWLPSVPLAERLAEEQQHKAEETRLIDTLRMRLALMDPHSDQTREGYILLGNAEAGRGNLMAAAAAWRTALESRFDPMLAAEVGEAVTETSGHVTDEAAALFRRALTESPPDAPWRPMAEKRLSEAGK